MRFLLNGVANRRVTGLSLTMAGHFEIEACRGHVATVRAGRGVDFARVNPSGTMPFR